MENNNETNPGFGDPMPVIKVVTTIKVIAGVAFLGAVGVRHVRKVRARKHTEKQFNEIIKNSF